MGGLKAGFHLLSTFTKSYHMPDTVIGYRQLWKKKTYFVFTFSKLTEQCEKYTMKELQ